MPTWLRHKGWRFHVFIGDTTRRPHVHITKAGTDVKVWLDSLELANNPDVKRSELKDLLAHARDNAEFLRNKWKDQFPDG